MPPTKTYTLSQQAINVLRQLVNAKGWAETLQEIYNAGRLVDRILPELDISWVKSEIELQAMTQEQVKAYQEQDKEWTAKKVTIDLNEKQVAVVHKAFKHFIDELIKNKNLGPLPVFSEIVDIFDIPLEDGGPKS